jgi:hypothetical protein
LEERLEERLEKAFVEAMLYEKFEKDGSNCGEL